MASRDFYIHGELMVMVKMQNLANSQLGVCHDQCRVEPRFRHADFQADDFGPDIPPDVQWRLSDAIIRMTLVHFDDGVLNTVVGESMGGGGPNAFTGAGTPMGAGGALYKSPNHYIGLNLIPGTGGNGTPWRFPATYLAERPMIWPLGTDRSLLELTFRAVPYVPLSFQIFSQGGTQATVPPGFPIPGAVAGTKVYITELVSAGAVLWDFTLQS